MPKAINLNDGWREEAVKARKRREEENAAMVQFAGLVESWVEGKLPLPTMLLAFHHVAMMHGAYAGKKTLRSALKSSIEEVSAIAPYIFPPDRLVKPRVKRKRGADAAA